MSAPFFNFDLNQTSTFSSSHRPVFSHVSLFWSEDMMISEDPSFSISSLMTRLMFWRTFKPRGRYEYTPANSLLMNPPRERRIAFFETSSAGASRRVLVKSLLCLMGLFYRKALHIEMHNNLTLSPKYY